MARPVKVKVQRFDPDIDSSPWFQEFTIPYEGTCRCALCGICKIKVNEKTVLSCDRIVKEGEEIILKPAEGHQLIRDLVVDLDERKGRRR